MTNLDQPRIQAKHIEDLIEYIRVRKAEIVNDANRLVNIPFIPEGFEKIILEFAFDALLLALAGSVRRYEAESEDKGNVNPAIRS